MAISTALGLWTLTVIVIGVLGADAARTGANKVRDLDLSVDIDVAVAGDVSSAVDAAREDFARADQLLGHPVLAPARVLPVVGRQLRSASALADTAHTVLTTAGGSLDAVRAELDRASGKSDGRVAALDRLLHELWEVREILGAVDLGPTEALIGPLHQARTEVAHKLDDAGARATDLYEIVSALRSVVNGPSRYLVLAANNAEMRLGSGMFLSIGAIDVVAGRLQITDPFEPAGELVLPAAVPLPDQVTQLWGWSAIGEDWRSLGLTGRFPVNAAIAADMWSALGRGPVDGVLAIDVQGLAALLRAVGPVEVDGRVIDSTNVIAHLLEEQYVDVDGSGDHADVARRERLSVLAGVVLERLGSSDVDVLDLVESLRAARDGRHLMVWSSDAAVQAGWEMVDADGDLGPTDLLVGMSNVDGSKLDPYVHLDVDGSSQVHGDHVMVELTLRIANEAPDALPEYVTGVEGSPNYRGLVAAHLPTGATDVALDGLDGRSAFGRDGQTVVIAAPVQVPRGEARVGVLRFRLSRTELAATSIQPDARIPASRWTLGGENHHLHSRRAWPPHVP